MPKNTQRHIQSLPQSFTPAHGLNHPSQMWSFPLHAHLLQPAPQITALPTKMQPRFEKQLTSVAGVTQRHTPGPTGATTGRPPRRGTKRAELGAGLRPNPRAAVPAGTTGRSPPAAAGELGSRWLPGKLPFQAQFFHFCCRRLRR